MFSFWKKQQHNQPQTKISALQQKKKKEQSTFGKNTASVLSLVWHKNNQPEWQNSTSYFFTRVFQHPTCNLSFTLYSYN